MLWSFTYAAGTTFPIIIISASEIREEEAEEDRSTCEQYCICTPYKSRATYCKMSAVKMEASIYQLCRNLECPWSHCEWLKRLGNRSGSFGAKVTKIQDRRLRVVLDCVGFLRRSFK